MQDEGTERLRTFLQERAQDSVDVEEIIRATLEAFDRYDKSLPDKSELAEKARRLALASSDMLRLLEQSEDLVFFLRNSNTLSRGLEWGKKSLQESREFDSNIAKLPDILRLIERSASSLVDPSGSSPLLKRRGKPVDEGRLGLGIELTGLYSFATGKEPTVSGESTFELPITDFGRFVAAAAAGRASGAKLKTGFAKFLRNARSEFQKGAIKLEK